tara:strand:+ start:906 stop:1487 length:582 start_codon:yes stop_codon:yes gene_type:complete
MENKENFLYLVVIGGKASKANIELHDVRWVIGSKIEDTFDDLRTNWFGLREGLHIDSYKKIKSIDGYKINLKNVENRKSEKIYLNNEINSSKNLWFVNIGGYDPSSMQEKHEFGLVVASNSLEAKNKAKSKWLIGCKKKHKDDIASLGIFSDIDDFEIIRNIDNWVIELTPENNFYQETNSPDWFGYLRIDNR